MGVAITCSHCGKQVNSDEGYTHCPDCSRPFTTPASSPKPNVQKAIKVTDDKTPVADQSKPSPDPATKK